ncbi:MAG: hypothetical protein V3V35_03440 [Dehalococcoidia bacterium]
MTQEERSELTRLLSMLLGDIHRLPPESVGIVIEVDERMRRGDAGPEDLLRLRAVALRQE